MLVIVLLPSMTTLTAAIVVASFGIGVAMTAAYSVAGALLPPDAHVTGFGIMTTASLIGLAFSPVLAGIVGASGLTRRVRGERRPARGHWHCGRVGHACVHRQRVDGADRTAPDA